MKHTPKHATLFMRVLAAAIIGFVFITINTLIPRTAHAAHNTIPVQNPGHAHLLKPQQAPKSQQTRPAVSSNQSPFTYNGGKVMKTTVTYAIFWEPPTLPDGSSSSVSPSYNSLIQRFFGDVGGSNLYNNLTQYSDSTGLIQNQSTFGGAWIDTTPYPATDCDTSHTIHNCLVTSDIFHEITTAMTANHWTNDITHLFYVYTALGESSCEFTNSLSCSGSAFCAWHNYDYYQQNDLVLAYVPYPATSGCNYYLSPNNDVNADAAISMSSHELMEAATDPVISGRFATGWTDNNGNEISDVCSIYSPPTQIWNGHPYVVQEGWSNVTSECTVGWYNWPMYGGDQGHSRFNTHEVALSPANVAQLSLAWIAPTGGGNTAGLPSIAYGVAFVGASDDKLYAFNARTGALLWTGATGGAIDLSTPAIANGVVYINAEDNKLYAFDAFGCGSTTCSPLWTAHEGSGGYLSSATPVIANGVVYQSGFGNSTLYAFNANGCGQATCSPLWTAYLSSNIAAVPAVANGIVYVGTFAGTLYAFNANGCGSATCSSPLWKAILPSASIASPPAVVNGMVYIGSDTSTIGSSQASKMFVFNANGCGSATCSPLWTATTGGYNSTPAVANGIVYIGSWDHNLYAFNASGCGSSSCSPLWTATAGDGVTAPTVANGVVYVSSWDHHLYAFNASGCGSSSCSALWFAVIGTDIANAPVVVNGTVYASSSNHTLYAYRLPGQTLFADTFSHGTGAWTPISGWWISCVGIIGMGSGPAYCDDSITGGLSVAQAGNQSWQNYSVYSNVSSGIGIGINNGGIALLGRVQDANHYYQLELRKDSSGVPSLFIWKYDGVSFTDLGQGPYNFSANTSYRLRLDMNGNNLIGYVSADNGATWQSPVRTTDSSYTSGGIGLRSWNEFGQYQNVQVITDM